MPSGRDRSKPVIRRCRVLFILTAGFDPAGRTDELTVEYREHTRNELDCSQAEIVTTSIPAWTEETLGVARKAALMFAAEWCRRHHIAFDDRRLLLRQYHSTGQQTWLVGGYFPKGSSKWNRAANQTSSSESAPAAQHDSASGTTDADDSAELEVITDLSDDESGELPVMSHSPAATGTPAANGTPAAERSSIVEPWKDRLAEGLAWLRSQPKDRLVKGGAVAAVVLLLLIWLPSLFRSANPDEAVQEEPADDSDAVAASTGGSSANTRTEALPKPRFESGTLRIDTPQPGWRVLVDNELVTDDKGEPVTTPCAVTAQQGVRTVTLVRDGWFNLSEVVEFKADGEVELSPSENSGAQITDLLKAPYRGVEPGTAVPLKALNTDRSERDPWLTADGLSLWFAGDRADGRGLYVSTRLSPFDEFSEPQIVLRSPDMPGTPSLTDDALHLVYTVPGKARLMSVNRENPLADFIDKEPLQHSTSRAPHWPSSQMTGNGLRLYWVESSGSLLTTFGTVRKSVDSTFGKPFKVALPGVHPCLSSDGLRQYMLEDGAIKRYRRTTPTGRFIEEAVIGSAKIPELVESPLSRQITVSHDEQWVIFCDAPEQGGDLYLLRLSNGPQWGIAPTGKPVPPKAALVKTVKPSASEELMPLMPEPKPESQPKPVDPRSLPLPYTSHHTTLTTLLAARQYPEAEALLAAAKNNPALQPFAEPLSWDEEEFQAITGFWKDIETITSGLKPGQKLLFGISEFEFTGLSDGALVLKRAGVEVKKKIAALTASELVALFDKNIPIDDQSAQSRFAIFLAFDPSATARTRDVRWNRSGMKADVFESRRAERRLRQARGEFDRANFAAGIAFLNETKTLAAGTDIAKQAEDLEARLYDFVKWRPVGPRSWKVDGNLYGAALMRSRGSLLLSEREYARFELSLEWMVEADTTAQGGVFFHYPGSGDPGDNAFKIHLANDAGIRPDNFTTGSLFGQSPPEENAAKPPGEWNTLVLRVIEDRVTVIINGKKVLATVAQKDGLGKSGYVALDGAAGGISYRKMLLSELPAP